jgi:AhpD family alkylhydroperoxidase
VKVYTDGLKKLICKSGQKGGNMNRQQVYKEIEETLGVVPGFLKKLPDSTLELEWGLMKQSEMVPGAIPNKYRELIGIAVAAATRCKYCTLFHTEMAKLNGATDAEIEDAVHFAKETMGWSTYINGLQIEYDEFKKEVLKAVDHARKVSAGR